MTRTRRQLWPALFAALLAAGPAWAQRGGPAPPPQTARDAAPIDLVGDWTALVNEDWRHRMFTGQRGDYDLVPLNAEGQRLADAWTGEAPPPDGRCLMAYGAAGVMRLPTHLRIDWENDNTLRIDLDAGTQTRLFHFGDVDPPAEPTLQGHSVAEWEVYGGFSGRGAGVSLAQVPMGGNMRAETTHMLPGYYLKNGIPYSGDAHMTEFFVRLTESNGDEYLLVQTYVDDPQYLTAHFVRTLTFKKLPDGSLWNPTPCTEY